MPWRSVIRSSEPSMGHFTGACPFGFCASDLPSRAGHPQTVPRRGSQVRSPDTLSRQLRPLPTHREVARVTCRIGLKGHLQRIDYVELRWLFAVPGAKMDPSLHPSRVAFLRESKGPA